ncbi:MAG: hypothetical protein Kow00121_67940 [Elainellaceae cyanobacterium]
MADPLLQPASNPSPESDFVPTKRSRLYLNYISGLHPLSWLLWIIPTIAASVGASVWSVQNILGLPELPQCRSVSTVNGSSSAWLYCAEQIAGNKEVKGLKRAILLVSNVDANDSLRPTADRRIEQWTKEILQLGEAEFQAGKLDEAIDIAKEVPRTVQTYQLVTDRIEQWRSIWEQAEELYQQAEEDTDQRQWRAAIQTAQGLLTLGNQYWATTQHRELMASIQAAKDLDAAQTQTQAQVRKSRSSDPLQDYFARRERDRAQAAAAHLDTARQLASASTISGLEAAIDEAQQVLYGDPRYEEARTAIEAWQDQIETIEDAPYLERARALASQGDLESIEAAIQEARQIGWGRSLYEEANGQIEQWREVAYQLRVQRQTEQLDELSSGNPGVDALPAGGVNSAPPQIIPVNSP